jgi:hypothetical protein
MRCEKNEVYIVHPIEMPDEGPVQEEVGNFTVVNTDRLLKNMWKEGDIDFIAIGDKYKCPNCGHEVVVDCGEPIIASPFRGITQKHLKRMLKEAREKREVIEIRRK